MDFSALVQHCIFAYLEASLLVSGSVNTTHASNKFRMSRQNMAKHVKEWKKRNTSRYDPNHKVFVSNGNKSFIFSTKAQAEEFLSSLDKIIAVSFQSYTTPIDDS